jgi:hypothetical protein
MWSKSGSSLRSILRMAEKSTVAPVELRSVSDAAQNNMTANAQWTKRKRSKKSMTITPG